MKILLVASMAVFVITVGRMGPDTAPDGDARVRPNIVFMLSDDHRSGTMGCEGHPWAQTPALDRLANEGVRFANAFVTTSLCSPARASFLTGMYARRHGVLDNATALSPDVPSLASALTASGYDSIYIGKYHMGDQRSRPGFTRSATYVGQGVYHGSEFLVDGKSERTERWIDDVATDYAVEFLREDRDHPFFLTIGFKAAHGPPMAPKDLRSLYEGETLPAPPNADALTPFPRKRELRDLMNRDQIGSRDFTTPEDWAADPSRRHRDLWQGKLLRAAGVSKLSEVPNWLGPDLANYHRQIHSIDRNVGRILDVLDELEVADNTIVVYASDNGLLNGEHGLRFKRVAYESSMRIPLIFRYPGAGDGGRTVAPLVLNIDLAPTLLDFAGLPAPEAMQGVSWRPLLETRQSTDPDDGYEWREAFLYEYTHERGYFNPALFAARTDRWKLIRYPGYPSWTELFDLHSDPYELANLAADPEHGSTLETMTGLLEELQLAAGPRPRAGR